MNEQEPQLEEQYHPTRSDVDPKASEDKSPSLGGTIYWQMLVALFGFVVSLGFQLTIGLPILVDYFCGAQESQIDFLRCSEISLRSTFLVSLALTSSLGVALGASLIGSFRKMKGSLLFSWAMTYLYFAFFASLYKDFFLDQAVGGGNNSYLLALVAIGGGLLAAIAYHVPQWVLGSPKPDQIEQRLAEES